MVLAYTKLSFNFCHSKNIRDNELRRKVQKTERKLQTFQAHQIYEFHHYQSSRWTHDEMGLGLDGISKGYILVFIAHFYSSLTLSFLLTRSVSLLHFTGCDMMEHISHKAKPSGRFLNLCTPTAQNVPGVKCPPSTNGAFFSVECQVFQGKISTGQNVIVQKPTKYVCNLNQYTLGQSIWSITFFTLTFIEIHCDYNKGFVFALNAWVWLHLRCFFRHTRHHLCSPVKSTHCWRLHHTAACFASSCFACSV